MIIVSVMYLTSTGMTLMKMLREHGSLYIKIFILAFACLTIIATYIIIDESYAKQLS